MSREQTSSDAPTAPTLQAVLWDMDGTLIDTEPYWIAEEIAMVTEAGGHWTQEDGLDLVGRALTDSARIILERTPVTGTPEQVVDRLLTGVIRRCREELPWRPGARDLLAAMRAEGRPQALVTMSWVPLAQVLLDALEPGTFEAVVTGDRVSQGKPHPEPYLTAAASLRRSVHECLAVEDSPTGVASAVAAQVPTLGVQHLLALEERPGLVVRDSLADLQPHDLREIHRDLTRQ